MIYEEFKLLATVLPVTKEILEWSLLLFDHKCAILFFDLAFNGPVQDGYSLHLL